MDCRNRPSGAAPPCLILCKIWLPACLKSRAAALQVKIFADGADLASILELAKNPLIAGFTTNPTLMRKAGVTDYESFGRELTRAIPDRPFSFEVLSDDFDEMEQQALQHCGLGRKRLRENPHHQHPPRKVPRR